MVRATFTLLWKDVRHHFLAVLGGLVVLFMGWLACVAFALIHQDPSLLSAGVNAVYWFGGPYFATTVVRRWFIIEREDRSHEFLLTLPMRDGARFWIRYVVATAISVFWCEIAIFAVAVIAVRQELMPLSWLFHIAVQVAAYVWAWTALSVFAAHVGRYRWPAWGILFLVVASVGDWMGVESFQVLGWQAVLAQPVVITRAAFPWTGLGVTGAWAAAATVSALFRCVYRQGLWVDRAWEPLTPQRRAVVAGVIAGVALLGDMVSLWHEESPPWDGIREVTPCVRTAAPPGSLPGAVAVHVAAILDGWGATPADWPVLVILRREAIEAEPPPARGSIPIVMGDGESVRDAVVKALERALIVHLGSRDWRVRGMAERHAGRDLDPVLVRRLSWLGAEVRATDLLDRDRLDARLGASSSGAVAAMGTLCGVDPASAAFEAELRRRLAAIPGRHLPIAGEITRGSDFGIGVLLRWTLSTAPAATRLEWVQLPPLRHLPPPDARVASAPITIGTGLVPTRLDPSANLMARFVSDIEGTGPVASAWVELSP